MRAPSARRIATSAFCATFLIGVAAPTAWRPTRRGNSLASRSRLPPTGHRRHGRRHVPFITGLVVALKAVTDKVTALILAVVGDVGGLIPALTLERPS
ncbi:hypothetical protein [Streptomyces ureilyticus]|uniref:Uncharacterized protein n=1 Tax=Streptomyces ureilyticus TaxID=1775131 RepID=A0ABX0E937_9ACTN|nr:hypothetical protein [Streptomyces ureilyticus]NGO48107.1 hypothetical protein [Streptomyces ureilyticus]